MALSPKEPQLKQAPMFSFTTTVSPTTPVSPPRASLADMKPRQLSITKDLVPLFFFHLERFQFGDASRVLGLASVRDASLFPLLPHTPVSLFEFPHSHHTQSLSYRLK